MCLPLLGNRLLSVRRMCASVKRRRPLRDLVPKMAQSEILIRFKMISNLC